MLWLGRVRCVVETLWDGRAVVCVVGLGCCWCCEEQDGEAVEELNHREGEGRGRWLVRCEFRFLPWSVLKVVE